MSIIIGGDLAPVKTNAMLFEDGEIAELVDEALLQILESSDFRIFNLETPLTDHLKPIPKEGANLIVPSKCVRGLSEIKCNLLVLANNHILDQDSDGLFSTINALEEHNIAHVGAGKSLKEAQEPFFFQIKGKRYGVYACAEHEFSIALGNNAGANPFDPVESFDHIEKMSNNCDYSIILYHGGKEHYRYPSPNLQKICRKMIEKGADLVICQHSHCIGCKEEYLDGTIVYGQGNFLFDNQNNEYWNTGLLVQINDNGEIDYIPIMKNDHGVRLATELETAKTMTAFSERSDEILHPGVLDMKYKEFASQSIEKYIFIFLGIYDSIVFRILNKITRRRFGKAVAKIFKKRYRLIVQNCIECEAHRELILEGLRML